MRKLFHYIQSHPKLFRTIGSALLFIIFFISNITAQFDRQLWFIGDERANSGLIFPGSISNPIPTNIKGLIDMSESNVMLANASVVNFYSNGQVVLNELNRPMPNSQFLKGSPRSMYGSALVDHPATCDQFYLFYTESTDDGPNRKLYYSVIDMTIIVEYAIFNGRGDVLPNQRDIDITSPGVDIGESLYIMDKVIPKEGSWLFASDRNNSSVIIYDISASGITVHKEYNLKQILSNFPAGDFSTVKFDSYNIDGTSSKVSIAPSSEEGNTGFPIACFAFNRETGEFDTNSIVRIADATTSTYGTAFSSDGSKFYYSDHIDKTLFQYDFNTTNTTLIGTSTHSGKSGGLKRAINDDIYWSNQFSIEPDGTPISTLSVIRAPNEPGISCDLDFNSYNINTSSLPIRVGIFPEIIIEALAPKAILIDQASCGLEDGSAGVLVDPKLEPLTYSWSTGSTQNMLTDVGQGTYIVEMVSLDGCRFIDSIEVTEIIRSPISNITTSYQDPSDCNTNNGTILISSPDLISGESFEILFSDDRGNDYLFIIDANAQQEIIIEGLSVGSYFDFMLGRVEEFCTLSFGSEITLSGMIDLPNLGNDTLLCAGDSYKLQLTEAFNSYLWSDGTTDSSITVTETGNYSVEISDINGCTATSSIFVLFNQKPDIGLDQLIELEIGDSIVLMPSITSTDSLTYEWSPPEGLSCSDCLSPTAKPLNDQAYFFEVNNESNCKDSATVIININNKTGLLFPNTFSPNGDGNNDIFEYTIASDAVARIKSFRIFNRWGEPTYVRLDIPRTEVGFGWDGMHQNEFADVGIYIYSVEVELLDGQVVSGHGDVLIVR